jgi:CSLREA domain-containing protein
MQVCANLTQKVSRFALRASWLLALVFLLLQPGEGYASSPIYVNSLGDVKQSSDGLCTLREAIIAANSNKPSGRVDGECVAGRKNRTDTINLMPGTYVLIRSDSGKEDAAQTGDLDIFGDVEIVGGPGTTISAGVIHDRVFHILDGNVTISGVTIKDGNVPGDGGGVYNSGVLKLENVTVSGNTASGSGGGLYNRGVLALTNSTIAGNVAAVGSGGVVNGGGGGAVHLWNTLIAGNMAAGVASDCAGTLSSLGYNLIQDTTGCIIGGDTTGNITGQDPVIGPLQNDEGTLIHPLLPGSPAIDAGDPVPDRYDPPAPATDQRGVPRPRGSFYDIGAYEVKDPPQSGSLVVVNTSDDVDDGICSFEHCSLREAISAAEAHPNGDAPDEIHFNIPAEPVIGLISALPAITDPVVIDGTTQPGGAVELDGSGAGEGVSGLEIIAGDSTIRGLTIVSFDGHGLLLNEGDNNTIEGNTIAHNNGDGIRVLYGSTGNAITGNDIHDNGGLGIDLGGDGPTPNDKDDIDSGANDVQNYPILFQAVPNDVTSTMLIVGRLNSSANTEFSLEFFASESCYPTVCGEQSFLGSVMSTTNESGDVYFQVTFDATDLEGGFIVATATDPDGNTSEFSPCVSVGADNDSWPRAFTLSLVGDPLSDSYEQYIDQLGQSRWFKFEVQPNSTVIIELTDLPANYDLTFYKDIVAAYEAFATLEGSEDLVKLSAEFAPSAFTPSAFTPSAFTPSAFTPSAFTPSAFTPSAFTPSAFTPSAFTPSAFTPSAFTPSAFTPSAFTSAQTRSLIGVSAFEGTASEGLIFNTWNNTGEFYVRVRGREGAFSLAAPFHLDVTLIPGPCGSVSAEGLPETSLTASDGDYETIVLIDRQRMTITDELETGLADFVARPEVNGVVVDVSEDERVAEANAQADTYYGCPYAKNVAADAIKDIVDDYRETNLDDDGNETLGYIVIIGNDNVIPFFRYPDNALLGHESNYVPPVFDFTASQASLRLGYVLSQDAYGASVDISLNATSFPIPDLAVGRLVETPQDIITVLDAYLLGTTDGVVPPPDSTLVTGYDFLEDAALAVQAELEAGTGTDADTLITPAHLSPQDPASWTADDLAGLLLENRYDLAFLAGHFSANDALAADYTTSLLTTDLVGSDVDMANAIFFSAGCHSGYNIVNEHGIPGITFEPDWAQAFAQKGATLIGGTGYQYGDTEFLEYSERLYLEFARQLRTGSGPVSIGQALVAAKQAYLADTPVLRGIHEKALLEATLFGLPMLSVDMPGERISPASEASIVGSTTPFPTNPGEALGLRYADVTVVPTLEQRTLELKNVDDDSVLFATYFSGSDGIVTNPAEPALPLEAKNVTVLGMVLRGVGFRGGSYADMLDVLPLTGAATTEIRGVHSPFWSDVFWPIRPWMVNYFGALTGGSTHLNLMAVQHKSSAPGSQTSTLRQFNSMDFRLYYSDNISTTTVSGVDSTPALADSPTIVRVTGVPSDTSAAFAVNVIGNPAAGIQEVWVTYTGMEAPFAGQWQSTDLEQSDDDSTLWEGTLDLQGTDPGSIRYIVQAVNGVGLVSLAANLGEYYTPGVAPVSPPPTELSLVVPEPTGPFGSLGTFSASLSDEAGEPLAGQIVHFALGAERRYAVTGGDGWATVDVPLLALPAQYIVRASFAGTVDHGYSSDSRLFEIVKQGTVLSLEPDPATVCSTDEHVMTATLKDAAERRLGEQMVFFIVTGEGGSSEEAVIADYAGRAVLGNVLLPPGDYQVEAYFNGTIPLSAGSVTLDSVAYLPSMATAQLRLLNTPPQAVDDYETVTEDGQVTIDVLANDTDIDIDDALTVDSVTQGEHGSVVNNGADVTYTPDADYCGSDSFAYTVADKYGGTDGAMVTIEVICENDAPVAVDDAYVTNEDVTLIVNAPGVLGNDSDAEGDPLEPILVSGPNHGTLTLNANGSFTYMPAPNYNGTDSFSYVANDGGVDSNVAIVTITIDPVNEPPICSSAEPSESIFWPPDKDFWPVTVLGVIDPDGDPFTITIVSIYQDEAVGKGKSFPDGQGLDTDTAWVRAERDGKGDGRVYHIVFTATDVHGDVCTAEVLTGIVPHDQGGDLQALDDGPPWYDSVTGDVVVP